MPAVRIVLILLVLGGLGLFILQNISPTLPLVVLGAKTLPLPLAIWVGGAIAAGAFTTLIIAGLISLGRPVSRRNAPKRPRFASNSFGAPRNPAATQRPSSRSAAKTRLQDDWETGSAKDEWDDWEEPEPARGSNVQPPQPEIRDRQDEDWANWDGYEEIYREPTYREPAQRSRDFEPIDRPPARTDFEVKQEPTTRYQAGSVYSFSYNKSDSSQEPVDRSDLDDRDLEDRNLDDRDLDDRNLDEQDQPFSQPDDSVSRSVNPSLDQPQRPSGGVYDAEYRVLTPPYRPDPVVETPEPEIDDDDWGLEEDEAFGRESRRDDDERRSRF